jgi:type II secretory pathway pseudopilin PulG
VLGSKHTLREGGYTLVELTVAVTVMGIIGVAFIGVIAHYFVVISRSNAQTEMTLASQNLLRTTVENIRYGDGVRQTNQIPDGNGPAGGWNTNNSAFVIIIAVPALDNSRNYIIDPNTGSPYMNELVYYKNGSTLYRRVLANPLATGNRMKTTCPPAAATTLCRADSLLAEYVNDMNFTLYDQNGATTTAATSARSVKIDLSMQRNAPGDPITVSNSIRVTLRNRF